MRFPGFRFSDLFRDRFDRNPRVIDTEGVELTVERGDLRSLDNDRVAVISSWSRTPVMSKSLSTYLKELDRLGYATLVVSTSGVSEPLQWLHGIPDKTVVVRRKNIGYDFGSLAAALHSVSSIRGAKHVLLTNDSMVGPFAPIDNLIRAAEQSDADVFGLTESYQIIHHPQSFFLMFREGVLEEEPWRRFFESVREQDDKVGVIQAYELGLSRHCAHEGYSWETFVSAYQTGAGEENPTLHGWRGIMDAGAPFLKRNLLVETERPEVSRQMATEIQYRYGEKVEDWLPGGYKLATAFTEDRVQTEE